MTKIGSGKLKEGGFPSIDDVIYRDAMVEGLRKIRRETAKLPTHFNGKLIAELSPIEKEAFNLSLQTESTRRAIEAQKIRKPEDDFEFILREMPPCIANPDAKDKDELTGKRELGIEEFQVVDRLRKSSKNTLGESQESATTKEGKERAIIGFTYSKPAELTKEEIKKVTKLEEIKSTPLEPEKPKKGFWRSFFSKDVQTDGPELERISDGKGGFKTRVKNAD